MIAFSKLQDFKDGKIINGTDRDYMSPVICLPVHGYICNKRFVFICFAPSAKNSNVHVYHLCLSMSPPSHSAVQLYVVGTTRYEPFLRHVQRVYISLPSYTDMISAIDPILKKKVLGWPHA